MMYESPSTSPSDSIFHDRSPAGAMNILSIHRCTPLPSPSCAFPSWPRRSSLYSPKDNQPDPFQVPDSFITDEELFQLPKYRVKETKRNMTVCQSFVSPSRAVPSMQAASQPRCDVSKSDRDIIRELVQLEKAKKAARKCRKGTISSKKTRTTSGGSKYMSPIME